jgi:hypothetical protein
MAFTFIKLSGRCFPNGPHGQSWEPVADFHHRQDNITLSFDMRKTSVENMLSLYKRGMTDLYGPASEVIPQLQKAVDAFHRLAETITPER